MSHEQTDCPAVRESGDHNWSAWTDRLKNSVPMLWHFCFECKREEWEFEQPEERIA